MQQNSGRNEVLSVTVLEFQDRCLELVSQVADFGSEVVITKDGQPVSRLVPIREPKTAPFGRDQDIIQIHADIVEPIDIEREAESNPDRVINP